MDCGSGGGVARGCDSSMSRGVLTVLAPAHSTVFFAILKAWRTIEQLQSPLTAVARARGQERISVRAFIHLRRETRTGSVAR